MAGDCGRHFAVDKLRHEDVVHVILPFSSTPVVCQKYPFIFLFLAVEFLSATKVSPSFRGFSACPKWSLKVLLVSNIVKFESSEEASSSLVFSTLILFFEHRSQNGRNFLPSLRIISGKRVTWLLFFGLQGFCYVGATSVWESAPPKNFYPNKSGDNRFCPIRALSSLVGENSS